MRHLVGTLVLATFAALAAGCSGNGGGSPVFDPVDGQRDPATSGRDPTDTATAGGGVQQGAEVSSGGGGGSSDGCFPCGKRFRCQQGEDESEFDTDSRGGECVVDGAVLACGGAVTVQGQTVGGWSLSGNTLTVSAGSTTVTCTER